jgi:ATP-dependent Lon protease
MGPNNGRTTKLALVPLPKGTVLLPGVTLRIPIVNRPDLSNLLSSLVDRQSAVKRDGNVITFGCVPLSSPFLSKDGQHLIDNGTLDDDKKEVYDAIDAGQARKEDLFRFGTVGKVIGVQRRANLEASLVVQGIQRFTIRRILKERPYFEAEMIVHDDKG